MSLLKVSDRIKGSDPTASIKELCKLYPGRVVFTTSFGIEDQVITDMIFANDLPVKVITLDTGRLFEETYKVFSNTLKRYNKTILTFAPESGDIEELINNKGPYSFYKSVEARKECCFIRKVKPLNRALEGMYIWISGIRKEQSASRTDMQIVEEDEKRRLIKYNPLFDWTLKEVEDYISRNKVPYNELHNKGFVSIGCEPCTRAIKEGEDFRAGRWWWENNSGIECGLHR